MEFEFDRFNILQIKEQINTFRDIPKAFSICMEAEEIDVDIDFEGDVTREVLMEVVENLNEFDNMVQNDNMQEAMKSKLHVQNFYFNPAWMTIAENKVTIGYWGAIVNSQFDVIFEKDEQGTWKMI